MTTRLSPRRAERHTCHAEGCDVRVPPRLFMCLPHWRMVPEPLKRELRLVYVPGQEERMDPTAEYLDVARRAVEAVAGKEGRRADPVLFDVELRESRR